MEANVFLAKLKASGSETDIIDLEHAFCVIKDISSKLSTKDRATYCLNVLCVLCRNLEKIPSWASKIDNKSLVVLTIDCLRETRTLPASDKVKVLACVYHIHRYATKQLTPTPPELILKLSYMPFESDLLPAYAKTYWNIIVDRILYIEKLKAKNNIQKLLPKFTEDILNVIKIYDTLQFCSTVLTFLVKKLHYLYSNVNSVELIKVYVKIFEEISLKNDLKSFKKVNDKDMLDLYVKINDCFYVVVENYLKSNIKDGTINKVIQTVILFIGHCPDLLHCVQMFYLNGFCSIFNNDNEIITETIFNNFIKSFETTEKIGYKKALIATYPYLSQILRLYLEYLVNNEKKISGEIKTSLLNLMLFLSENLENCQQILKCDSCLVNSGLHDGLRLTFLAKNLLIGENDSAILNTYYLIIEQQYGILTKLRKLGCKNTEKCYKKMQSDVHNTAINLNKLKKYEISIKLFEMYLRNEVLHFKGEQDMKNISRALYNKGICELDALNYENALTDAYLSLIFACPEGLSSQKYMSLVMDIKAKALKAKSDDDDDVTQVDEFQMMTALDICSMAIDDKKYGNLKPFFCDLKFSILLKHEFDMYSKLWPSILPIAGICKTLYDLNQHDIPWMNANDNKIEETLYEVIFSTPNAVRNIHNKYYTDVVTELTEYVNNVDVKTTQMNINKAVLYLLKCEVDLAAAGHKYGWKIEPNMNFENLQASRTIIQEYEATAHAIEAVKILTDIIKNINSVPKTVVMENLLKIIEIFVPLLIHLYRHTEGLQLAYICCVLAKYLNNKETYLRNTSTIIYHASKQTKKLSDIINNANEYCSELILNKDTIEIALVYLCDCSIFYSKINMYNLSAKLYQAVQAKILKEYDLNPDYNLNFAVGRLLEAQTYLNVQEPSALSAAVNAHRHHLTVVNNASTWTSRRQTSLTLKLHITNTSLHTTTLCGYIKCIQRAKSSAGSGFNATTALGQAMLMLDSCSTYAFDEIRIKLDNSLKYTIGLQPYADQPISVQPESKPLKLTTETDIEIMRETMTFKNQISPTLNISIPRFKIPEFLTHKNCDCVNCKMIFSCIIACRIVGVEASMYFRANEFAIAKNYFDGALECCHMLKKKIDSFNCDYDEIVSGIVKDIFGKEFQKVEIEILIDAAFFELSQRNFKMADEYIVKINEILQENSFNQYLRNEVYNLMTTAAKLRNYKKEINKLDEDFDSMKVTHTEIEPPKTPEAKTDKPPKLPRIKVKDDEIPSTRRKVIKLNLDEAVDDDTESKGAIKKHEFKIPDLVITKPALESITPTPRRVKAKVIQEPNKDINVYQTPKPKHNESEFFTPIETPSDQFFTPLSTIKTYKKKSLRQGIVKNLENEFSTPKKTDESLVKQFENLALNSIKKDIPLEPKGKAKPTKESTNKGNDEITKKKVETGSLKALKDKRSLRRAVSPGKLDNSEKPVRATRLRQPTKWNSQEK